MPLGVTRGRNDPVHVDFSADPHLLVLGAEGTGKTTALRTVLRGIARQYTPDQARVLCVDYRRSWLNAACGPDHLLDHVRAPQQLSALVPDVHAALSRRQGRQWAGPELFVVIDDYDLVATPSNQPLAPLLDLLPLAGEIGLRVVLALRPGQGRLLAHDPVARALRDLSAPGLALGVSLDAGALFGALSASALPPGQGLLVSAQGEGRPVQVDWTSHDLA
ncbi:FtsK/SpoIIIE domain-containing protein [Streptoalloteichus hindustanus]|uniref:FtsK/SpoIIIE family protein n=1 Tax=Streptoalloteichus hindustanus TaxID=2017 RepID=A0A1M4UP37_STRHI|nr:FtsK/SpoIIIE domain-containing protein [Streptoalloteichus hindustanus]SHE58454.1 FtsK/SpoIIIE family protein [Streptoalloteichus hindustanus]